MNSRNISEIIFYYRPEWTCGRYNKDHKVAIFYNLIEGMSYFFEDESAEVIGQILSIERKHHFTVDSIASAVDLTHEELLTFLQELQSLNLITSNVFSDDEIKGYRMAVAKRKKERLDKKHVVISKTPYKKDDAEACFLYKVGGVTQAMFELTYTCSENCIHCYNSGATRNAEEISHRYSDHELSLEDYKRIIDQLYDEGCFKIALSGGDPFSKSCTWDIIEYLYEKGIAIEIYTNAVALVGKVERLIKYHPCLMSISLYADKPEVHDAITRLRGSWAKTMSVINELGNYAVPMDIKTCILRNNLKSYRGITDIARKAGGTALFEACINDSVEGDKCVSKYLRLTPEEYTIIFRDNNIDLYVGLDIENFGKQIHHLDKPICDGGRWAVCISPTGDIMPCTGFHFCFGNLKNSSFREVIETSESWKEWKDSKLSDCTECTKHDYCDFCVICPGKAFSEHGDWKLPAENCCYIAKIRHKVAMDLMRGKDPLNGKSVDECIADLPEFQLPKLKRVFGSDHK